MHKIVASLVITSSILFAAEINNEKYQLIAQNVDTKDNIITATGNVVIYSPTYYLSADKVVFHQDSEHFELFDNVLIIKENNIQTQSNYAYVDLKNDIFNQSPTFLMENTNSIWTNAKESRKNKEIVKLDGTIISSCDCIDPDWSIRTSSADYDTENMWINAYNPRLYFKDVPVFYLPYWGFPTDTTRRTGLLLPLIGYSKGEGLYYSQPIFFAPAHNYDIELIPQIRTLRGSGAYSYLRYADSPDSILKLKTGYFKEKPKYKEKEGLENSEHFGVNLDYERRGILASKENHEDGLYASLKYLNDVEFITLEDNDNEITTDKKVESKLNYFYNTPNYYGGAYGKYYKNVGTIKNNNTDRYEQISNKNTLQELPQLHGHIYNQELFLDSLVYSLDTKFYNYTRREGITANIYELNLPISYSKNILDDYMYVGVENRSILTQYNYDNSKYKYDNGTLLQNTTSFFIGSDLIRPYTDYIHTVNLKASYNIPENIRKDGDIYGVTVKKIDKPITVEEKENNARYDELKDFPAIQDNKTINLDLNQSIYGKESLKQIVNHKMSQSIIYDSLDDPKAQDYENYLKFNHDYGSISGKVVYNMQDKTIVEKSASTSFNYENFTLTANYNNTKKTENKFNDRDDLESYGYSVSYGFAKDYSIKYRENYNLKDKVRNRQGIGLNIDDSCWNLDLLVEKDIKPQTGNNPNKEQTILYAFLTLKPVGGIRQKYRIDDNSNDFR